MMAAGVIPSFILAKTALAQTVDALRRFEVVNPINRNRSLREELEHASDLELPDRAIECLRTACAARDLTMVVINSQTQFRQAVPAEYFEVPAAGAEFERSFFGAYEELPKIVTNPDPLFHLVHSYQGWVHGFVEPEFRAWLVNPESGPQAGPQMRPFFHDSPAEDLNIRSGMPGRPAKGKHLIEDEFKRRVANQQVKPTLPEEARALFDWYKTEYPGAERPTIKTIRNNIRKLDPGRWVKKTRGG
jgi:hypothetical protein